ncbi:MAG: MYG1 family protein [Nitrososphaerota archaeon]
MKNISRIITHGGSAHVDDFFAVCLLLVKYPWATVVRVDQVDEFEEGAVYVDVGNALDPKRMIFDHHQDTKIPSSFILVLEHFYGYDYESLPKILKFLDLKDRIGPKAACEALGMKETTPSIVEAMLLRAFSEARKIGPFDPMHKVMMDIGRELITFIETYKSVKDSVKLIETKHGLVAVSHAGVPINMVKETFGGEQPIIGMIQPNARNARQTAIIKVDGNPLFDPTKVTSYPIAFTHPTGFMRIIDAPIDSVDIQKIIEEAISAGEEGQPHKHKNKNK